MQFAPIRRLSDGALAAAELQVRGPSGSALGTAESLRRAARMMQQEHALDRHKLSFAASDTAQMIADVLPLLVMVDLGSVDQADLENSLERLAVSVRPEEMLADPQRTLRKIDGARRAGRVICVDGFGVSEYAVTMLSLIEPDIIVTGPELLTRTSEPAMARLAHALAAHVERSHAVVIAEGVDTDALRLAAQTIGATYGFGALYPPVADPAAFLDEAVVPLPDAPVWSTPAADTTTPYRIGSAGHPPRRGTKRLLVEMSKALEMQASAAGGSVIVLGTFQHARNFTTRTAARWKRLADVAGLAGVYGVGLAPMVDGNVIHAPLDESDDIVNEWNVAVLSPHFCALLAARDLHDEGPEMERTFDFVQSYERLTVTQAVHSILSRFTYE